MNSHHPWMLAVLIFVSVTASSMRCCVADEQLRIVEKKRCQDSFLGLPLGRRVESKSGRRAVDSTQLGFPSGAPRLILHRIDFVSSSVGSAFTRAHQFDERGIGQGEISFGERSGCLIQQFNEPHFQDSAFATNPAFKAFRSAYLQTARKWTSSCTGKLLNLP